MVAGVELWIFVAVSAAYLSGGFVKGAVGFALPLVAIAGSASVLPAVDAVAILVLPVLFSNLVQAFRQGTEPLRATARRFWLVNAIVVGMIFVSAQLLPAMDDRAFFLTLGVAVALFTGVQLAGYRPLIPANREKHWGVGVGVLSGFYGGVSGIWGPPFMLYIAALGLSKQEQVRAAGLCFLLGGLALGPAHMLTGVLNERTALLSLMMIPVALLGQQIGQLAQDKISQALFQRLVLIVLMISALNFIRRGVS